MDMFEGSNGMGGEGERELKEGRRKASLILYNTHRAHARKGREWGSKGIDRGIWKRRRKEGARIV